jgi:hypothetical protein
MISCSFPRFSSVALLFSLFFEIKDMSSITAGEFGQGNIFFHEMLYIKRAVKYLYLKPCLAKYKLERSFSK